MSSAAVPRMKFSCMASVFERPGGESRGIRVVLSFLLGLTDLTASLAGRAKIDQNTAMARGRLKVATLLSVKHHDFVIVVELLGIPGFGKLRLEDLVRRPDRDLFANQS